MKRRSVVASRWGPMLAVWLFSRTSAAEPAAPGPAAAPSYHLSWSAEPDIAECPSAEARLTTAVTDRLGFNPFDARGERDVHVRLEQAGRTRRLVVTFSSDDATSSSTRQLESTADDCRVILEAGSLAIALAIREELERVVPRVVPPPPPAAPTPRPPTVHVTPPPPPPPHRRRGSRDAWACRWA